jgi:hypothetical protein
LGFLILGMSSTGLRSQSRCRAPHWPNSLMLARRRLSVDIVRPFLGNITK